MTAQTTKNSPLEEYVHEFRAKVEIITQEAKMRELLRVARHIAQSDCNVLISGESGTGKELIARYIHENSRRAGGPLLAINCGAFTEELLSSELFGHEKGAFTGAYIQKKGLVESASGGTLFLDEITEMPLSMQVKLLRVIQEKEVIRVGGTRTIGVDVRFVAASNRPIHDAIASGHLRDDLFFRLNVVTFHMPPLSERKADIPLLCAYFLKKCALSGKTRVTSISPEAIKILMDYDFPGNVRELANIIERGIAMATGSTIEVEHLPEDLRNKAFHVHRPPPGEKKRLQTLEEREREYIQWVLGEVKGNRTVAAKILGLDRSSLWRKLRRYGLESPEPA
ncbi:MAG: sigma-54 interaction domain-containing protein [Thermodesulfobacteriota bacterium]